MMVKLDDDSKIENYIIDLAVLAGKKSRIHPVDREFLNEHIDEILTIQPQKFIYYNLELGPDLYTTMLFANLPEVWERVILDDLLEIAEKFTSAFPFFTLIKFTYKYLEIDVINQLLALKSVKKSSDLFDQILQYLELQWNVLIKSKNDYEDFEDGFINVDLNNWMYIKQKFLTDNRVKPAFTSCAELHQYIQRLINYWKL